MLEAFDVVGYLWCTGDKGSGKSNLLCVVSEMAFLGLLILSSSSFATIRDIAHNGGTLAFDDSEKITDPDKRQLFLAGNRRGAFVTLKEKDEDGNWKNRYVSVFCPRLFSAISLPDAVLASRSIGIPLVRSTDLKRTRLNPLDHSVWPHDRQRLIDDLWATAVTRLPILRSWYDKAGRQARLMGRDLEPWRGILAVALWLQESHGVAGLHMRMEALSVAYQSDRDDLEGGDDATRLTIRVLLSMAKQSPGNQVVFDPTTLATMVDDLARQEGLIQQGNFTNARRVGWILKKLRFRKATSTRQNRRWEATRNEIERTARAYGLL